MKKLPNNIFSPEINKPRSLYRICIIYVALHNKINYNGANIPYEIKEDIDNFIEDFINDL